MTCKKLIATMLNSINYQQTKEGQGRHHCAGCAYEKGYIDGYNREESMSIKLEKPPLSQAGNVRHKSLMPRMH